MTSFGVVGIDLSLRRTAVVALAPRWQPGSWKDFASATFGGDAEQTPEGLAERLHRIAEGVLKFVEARPYVSGKARVFVEDHAYGLAGKSGIRLAELHGAVKARLYGAGYVVVPVNMATARKVFLGKVPQGKGAVQAAVHEALQRLSPPWGEGSDEGDALIVANAGRHLLGLPCMTVAAG